MAQKHKKKKSKAKANGNSSHTEDTEQHPEQDNENETIEDDHEPDSPIDEQENHATISEAKHSPTTEHNSVLPLTEEPRKEDEIPEDRERSTQNEAAGAQADDSVLPLTQEPEERNARLADGGNAATNIAQTKEIIAEEEPSVPVEAGLPEAEAAFEPPSNGANHISATDSIPPSEVPEQQASNELSKETEERLAAAAKERDDLRVEVTKLRKSLESIQQEHEAKLAGLKTQVEDAESGKEHAEVQYKTLLGKVNTIRAQLGERLKADAVRLIERRCLC